MKLILPFLLCLVLSLVAFGQTESQKQESDKDRIKREKKEDEQIAKKERKRQKQEAKEKLASAAIMTVDASAEKVGQALTQMAANEGMTMAEYQPPQTVFGQQTPYRVIYTRRTRSDEVFLAKLALGGLFYKVGDTALYVGFEIRPNGESSSTVRGLIGFIGLTTGGVRYYELTHAKAARPKLDYFMEEAKRLAELGNEPQ